MHERGVAIAIAFGSENDIGSAADPAYSVLGPNAGIVLVVTIVDKHHLGGGMDFLQPFFAQRAGNGVGGAFAGDDNDAIAAGTGGIDQEFVSAVWRIKLADDNAESETGHWGG